MTRGRGRAAVFGLAALVCAALAAAMANGYSQQAEQQYGPLSDVLVAAAVIEPGTEIDERAAGRSLVVRKVPSQFIPPDVLVAPAEALGSRPAVTLLPGSYVTAAAMRQARPGDDRDHAQEPAPGSPVEVTVSGAGALVAAGSRAGSTVDVVVTGEPGPGGGIAPPRVVARAVPLLDLRRGGAEPGMPGGDSWIATLQLRRAAALRLIRAEDFARSIRLLSSSPG